ncbi:MAG: GntR family transcriptional regulator [Bryobacteraceae bacterium]
MSTSRTRARPKALRESRSEYLAQRAHRELRQRIMMGEFRAGDRLKEDTLVRLLGVSRSVVRQALVQLTAEGLLEDEPKRGKRVVEYSQETLAKLLPIRVALEQLAVRKAVANLNPSHAGEFQEMAARLCDPNLELAEQDALDVKLHQKIWTLAANDELERLLQRVAGPFLMTSHAAVLRTLSRHSSAAISWQQAVLERERHASGHQLLVEAICRRDAEVAAKAMADHLLYNHETSPEEYARDLAKLVLDSSKREGGSESRG